MSTPNAQSIPRASLLGVAPEIRLHIYHYVFDESNIILNLEPEKEYVESERFAQPDLATYPDAITQVNSFFGREALYLLHASTSLCVRPKRVFYGKDLGSNALPKGLLGRLRKISAHYEELSRFLPVDDLKSLECVSVRWTSNVKNDELVGYTKMTEAKLHQVFLDQLTWGLKTSGHEPDLISLRSRLACSGRNIRILWSLQISPKKWKGDWGRSALIDLDAGVVLRTNVMDVMEWHDKVDATLLHFGVD